MKNNRKGFTIVELVIVIAVIAILAAVLIPTFASLNKKAKVAADTQLAKHLNTALATDEALNGAPGVRSARYATDGHDTTANNRKLLSELEGKENRKARFRTVISLIRNGVETQVEGIVEGRIATQEAGCGGFGYDPLFIPVGHEISFAEMSAEEKNAISHRGRAVAALVKIL